MPEDIQKRAKPQPIGTRGKGLTGEEKSDRASGDGT